MAFVANADALLYYNDVMFAGAIFVFCPIFFVEQVLIVVAILGRLILDIFFCFCVFFFSERKINLNPCYKQTLCK